MPLCFLLLAFLPLACTGSQAQVDRAAHFHGTNLEAGGTAVAGAVFLIGAGINAGVKAINRVNPITTRRYLEHNDPDSSMNKSIVEYLDTKGDTRKERRPGESVESWWRRVQRSKSR